MLIKFSSCYLFITKYPNLSLSLSLAGVPRIKETDLRFRTRHSRSASRVSGNSISRTRGAHLTLPRGFCSQQLSPFSLGPCSGIQKVQPTRTR